MNDEDVGKTAHILKSDVHRLAQIYSKYSRGSKSLRPVGKSPSPTTCIENDLTIMLERYNAIRTLSSNPDLQRMCRNGTVFMDKLLLGPGGFITAAEILGDLME